MRVFEVMCQPVRTVQPRTTAEDARGIMRTARVQHLVVTENSAVIGVVADQDLEQAGAAQNVRDVMTSPAVTVSRTDTVRKVANLLQAGTIGCVPVVDHGRLVGIVTTSDLLRLIGRGVDRPASQVRRTLNYRVPHRKTVSGSGRW